MTQRMARLPRVAAAVGILGLAFGAVAIGESKSPLDPMADAHFTATYAATGSSGPRLQQGAGYQEVAGVTEEGTVSVTDPRITGAWQ
jgi:hypothetical protein